MAPYWAELKAQLGAIGTEHYLQVSFNWKAIVSHAIKKILHEGGIRCLKPLESH